MSENLGTERNPAATVKSLRSAKDWLNDGECCGQKDSDGVCAAPACTFGTALRWFHKAADEIEALIAERDVPQYVKDSIRGAQVAPDEIG